MDVDNTRREVIEMANIDANGHGSAKSESSLDGEEEGKVVWRERSKQDEGKDSYGRTCLIVYV